MARVLRRRRGMSPLPSPSFLVGIMLGGLAAAAVFFVQALRQAALP